jgi:Zn-dependent protease
MEQNEAGPSPPTPQPPPLPPVGSGMQPHQSSATNVSDKLKKFLAPLGVIGVLVLKFFAKVKFILLPVLKFLPVILKTGGTMLLSIGAYAMVWGVWFAVGFVLLIFIHECGHLVAAKRLGLKVGAPVFIPFMGALIALKEAPRNAWIEAQVGIGGPLFGAAGAAMCEGIYHATGNPMFRGLAYSGFFLNLFNLMPVGFLDGGRIVTALSPWLWIVGFSILAVMTVTHFNFLLMLILIASVPRLISLFKEKSDEERRYFEVTASQRLLMGILYFGLIALLVLGMKICLIPHETLRDQ